MEMSKTKRHVNVQDKRRKMVFLYVFSENANAKLLFFFFFFAQDKSIPSLKSYSDGE